MRATTSFLVALALLSAACGTATNSVASVWASDANPEITPPPPTPGPSSLAWKACGEPGERFECATLTVPLDHDAPHGPTIDLAVIRLPAPPAATRLGSLVVNPGGPGGSGVEFVRAAAVDTFPTELRTRFDIVGFDPRGVGTSRPITCGGSAGDLLALDLAPDDDGERRAVLNAAQRTARDCQVTDGAVLPHVSTADVARDLDLLRAALGDAKLTYVGYSYGTFIGSSYAALYPDRVRALVLDGAVDPALDLVGRARG
ncbi:MAG: alpha/beta hydrolase, partial [Actinomycetota bacterium]|nr:alpha/beta hydrolase [Actinomycetota bacterium]